MMATPLSTLHSARVSRGWAEVLDVIINGYLNGVETVLAGFAGGTSLS